MKNRVLRGLLFSLISLSLVTSILLTVMFGNVDAKYFKSWSNSLDVEVTQDMILRYKIKDDNNTSGTVGVYADSENISQKIKLGTSVTAENAIYEIEFPLAFTGLHTVDFTVEFSRAGSTADFYVAKSLVNNAEVASLNNPVGCKFYSRSGFTSTYTRLIYDNTDEPNATTNEVHARQPYNYTRTYDVNQNFQWKTLAPSKAEHVTLSVDATTTKVYLCWDLRGLTTADTYTLKLSNIKVTKIDTPDGPYFDFPNMYYVNNALVPTPSHSTTSSYGTTGGHPQRVTFRSPEAITIAGKWEAGKTRQSMARGTYTTEATYDSMTMQAEKLAVGYHNGNIIDYTYVKDTEGFEDKTDNYSNVFSFGVPIRNVKNETTYKVTFDISFARQGGMDTDGKGEDVENCTNAGNATYASYNKIFEDGAKAYDFHSYLYKGAGCNNASLISGAANKSVAYSILGVNDVDYGKGQVVLNHKTLYNGNTIITNLKGNSVTRFNEYTLHANTAYNSVSSINNHLNVSEYSTDMKYNWFNAVRHVEYNGENEINWITFKNTTFSFNVDATYTSAAQMENLQWVWSIDSFRPKSWYRIKIENLRIEEVPQYGSEVTSIAFSGNSNITLSGYDVAGLYRGSNGTGQNFDPRGKGGVPYAAMNIYGPAYDANNVSVANSSLAQKITLSGMAACKGGIAKYMWSADGGRSWYDMESQTLSNATAAQLKTLEGKVDSSVLGLTSYTSTTWSSYPCNHVAFSTSTDAKNAVFTVVANLKGTPYEGKNCLDIIFAAVPASNQNLRCEVYKVYNYNDRMHYVSYIDMIRSDITVESNTNSTAHQLVFDRVTSTSDSKIAMSSLVDVPEYPKGSNDNVTWDAGKVGVYRYYRGKSEVTSDYDSLRILASDIPVKTTLSLYGEVLIANGTREYVWSADGGETWTTISHPTSCHAMIESNAYSTYIQKLVASWISLNTGDDIYFGDYQNRGTGGQFTNSTTALKIDLSDYVGKNVDIIVAARSYGRPGALCPIARIDNVSVYGDPTKSPGTTGAGPGPFYSRYYAIKLNGTQVNAWRYAIDGTTALCGSSQWDVGVNLDSYTSYEPYNVNYVNVRLFNKLNNAISAGGTVSIDGYINCYKGVKEYRYTLDGGNNWTVINQTVPNHTDISFAGGAARVDASFDITRDGVNSNFCTYTNYGGTPITIKLPSGVTGVKKLLVVAESNAGYVYPILNISLNIT